jgi:L,D-peptidoglycan transpeptidase YkuD (ErfK/YbiS/YcfS/YnhG family)
MLKNAKIGRIISTGLLALFALSTACTKKELSIDAIGIPDATSQLIVLTSDSWTDWKGRLQRFERVNAQWKPVGHPVNIVLGRTGMAFGRGLHETVTDHREKLEGDGKSPAGLFALDTAFGYADSPPQGVSYPYLQATQTDFFVDDPNSRQYNQWVTLTDTTTNPQSQWKSFERMRREDMLYEYGVVIQHNMDPIISGKGSAIFFHVWRNPESSTAGCTAMARSDMLDLLNWLDVDLNPLVLVAPQDVLATVRYRAH